jgi:hypothetical protein
MKNPFEKVPFLPALPARQVASFSLGKQRK